MQLLLVDEEQGREFVGEEHQQGQRNTNKGRGLLVKNTNKGR